MARVVAADHARVTVPVLPADRRPARRPASPVRVIVVEHRPVYRAGVRSALEADSGITVVADVAAAAHVLAAVARFRPDVVLIGLQTGGLSLCRAVIERFPGVRTLVVGPGDDEEAVVGSVRAGARGYLRATAGSAEYPAVIHTVARGRSSFDASAVAAVRRSLAEQEVRDDRLTPRELDVLRLAGVGLSTPEIAARLQLSGTTVKSYLTNVMRKLGVTRRAGAVYVGRTRGLI
jgi:two-component system, NarL family, response regulator DevR